MSETPIPEGLRLETLDRSHPRGRFRSGRPEVDDWLSTKAMQSQDKLLSVTKVLLDETGEIVGYF